MGVSPNAQGSQAECSPLGLCGTVAGLARGISSALTQAFPPLLSEFQA